MTLSPTQLHRIASVLRHVAVRLAWGGRALHAQMLVVMADDLEDAAAKEKTTE